MRAEYNYRLNCGQYVLHLGDDPVGPVIDQVALCIDTSPDGGGLMKHGAPEMVQAYAKKSQAKLRALAPDWASAIVVATGRFPLEELNRCLTTTGYAAAMYRKLQAGALLPEPEATTERRRAAP